MLQAVVDAARPLTGKRGIRLRCGVMELVRLAWGVTADPRLALENVVENAIKYSHSRGRVHVDLVVSGGCAIFTVADQGLGIPARLQRDVFLEFVRAPNAKHQAAQDTGLGLTIVKEIFERHAGSISLRSEMNRGTIVTLSLALRRDPPLNARIAAAT